MKKLLLAVALVGGLTAACTPPPKLPDEPWRCTLWGTEGDDVLESTQHGERICGLQGDDHLIVRHSNVVVMGGEGHDLIEGDGVSRTTVYPGPGDDRMHFSDPVELLVRDGAEDALADGVLHEYPDNGEGADDLVVIGGRGVGAALGGGDDRFDGHRSGEPMTHEPGAYHYSVRGGEGDDVLRSRGRARHLLNGGPGNDTILVNGGLLDDAQANNLVGDLGDDLIYALNGYSDRIELGEDGPGGPLVVTPCGPAMPPTWPPLPGTYDFSCDLPQLADHRLTVTAHDIVASGTFLDQLMSADLDDLRGLLESLSLPTGDAAVGDQSSWPWAQH